MRDWCQTDTLVLLSLLVGIALGTLSGYTLHIDQLHYQEADNVEPG